MRTALFLCFLLPVCRIGFAQLHPVANESSVRFTIKNFGFNVVGSFGAPQGDIRFSPDNPEDARFDVYVEAAGINTDNELRDGHLRGEDYLDVKNFPRIRFISLNIKPERKKGSYRMTGNLTIKNKTQQISFPFTADPSGTGFLFAGSFRINRKDFGVGGSSTISDNLTVNLKVLAR